MQQHKLDQLSCVHERYLRIKERFLDFIRRDLFKDSTSFTHHSIALVNKTAHQGDAVTDASLDSSGSRTGGRLLVKI